MSLYVWDRWALVVKRYTVSAQGGCNGLGLGLGTIDKNNNKKTMRDEEIGFILNDVEDLRLLTYLYAFITRNILSLRPPTVSV